MKQNICITLCMLSLFSFLVSCSGNNNPSVTETFSAESENTAADETASVYTYPYDDYAGYTFRILNSEDIWDMVICVDPEEANGEVLNDAMYNRNLRTEDILNVNINEIRHPFNDVASVTKTSITAGDDEFDSIYIQDSNASAMASGGYFINLKTIDTLQLDQVWWDQIVLKNVTLGDKLYFITGDLHLMAFDGQMALFFNKDIFDDYSVDYPYEDVNSGSWTMDTMKIIMAQYVSDVNGDGKYSFDDNDHFGMTSYTDVLSAFIFGADELYIKNDTEDIPYFAMNSERFISVCEKIADMVAEDGMFMNINESDERHSIPFFMNSNAAFLAINMCTTQRLREMNDNFGILPLPKYNEEQKQYYSIMQFWTLFLTIPNTVSDTERTGVILDMLSYESNKTVLSAYYDINISQKGLRDEASIDMLNIIREGRTPNLSAIYSWGNTFVNTLLKDIAEGSTTVTSKIAANETAVTKAIDKTLAAFKEMN